MATDAALRLINNLKLRLPGSTTDMIIYELYNVLNDWFQDTNMWFEDIEFPVFPNTSPDPDVPDNLEYTLATNETASIFRLMGVVDNKGLQIVATMPIPGKILLSRSPTGGVNYTARLALTVSDPVQTGNIPECPDWVIQKYTNDFIDGVLGRMMMIPAKPYSSSQLATYHTRAFKIAIAFARQEFNRQNTFNVQPWKFPQAYNRRKSLR